MPLRRTRLAGQLTGVWYVYEPATGRTTDKISYSPDEEREDTVTDGRRVHHYLVRSSTGETGRVTATTGTDGHTRLTYRTGPWFVLPRQYDVAHQLSKMWGRATALVLQQRRLFGRAGDYMVLVRNRMPSTADREAIAEFLAGEWTGESEEEA